MSIAIRIETPSALVAHGKGYAFLDAIIAEGLSFDSDSLTLALVVHVCADCVYPVLLARFRSS